jgi:hypothetical protein
MALHLFIAGYPILQTHWLCPSALIEHLVAAVKCESGDFVNAWVYSHLLLHEGKGF